MYSLVEVWGAVLPGLGYGESDGLGERAQLGHHS